MAFATAATAEEEGVVLEGPVVAVVVVEEVVLDLGHLRTATIRPLLPALTALIVPSTPGQVAKSNNKVFKNQKWVSY